MGGGENPLTPLWFCHKRKKAAYMVRRGKPSQPRRWVSPVSLRSATRADQLCFPFPLVVQRPLEHREACRTASSSRSPLSTQCKTQTRAVAPQGRWPHVLVRPPAQSLPAGPWKQGPALRTASASRVAAERVQCGPLHGHRPVEWRGGGRGPVVCRVVSADGDKAGSGRLGRQGEGARV